MDALSDFSASFLVTKHSWKGNYFRLLCIGPNKIVTMDLKSLFRITNSWDLASSVVLVQVDSSNSLAFSIASVSGGKQSKMLFSCLKPEERLELLSYAHRPRMLEGKTVGKAYEVELYQGRNCYCTASLRISRIGIEELNSKHENMNINAIDEILFMKIKGYFTIAHHTNLLAISHGGKHSQLELFRFKDGEVVKDFAAMIENNAKEYIGLVIGCLGTITMEQVETRRVGLKGDDLESVADFPVLRKYTSSNSTWRTENGRGLEGDGKFQAHHSCCLEEKLILSISSMAVVERDHGTYAIVRTTSLSSLFSLIRCQEDDQKFIIVSEDPPIFRTFISSMRDAILAHLWSASCLCHNTNLCIVSHPFRRAVRFGMLCFPVAAEIESALLFFLAHPEKLEGIANPRILTAVSIFNANVAFSGLTSSENSDGIRSQSRERAIQDALYSVLSEYPIVNKPEVMVERCSCLRRLCLARAAFFSVSNSSSVFSLVSNVLSASLRHESHEVQKEAVDWVSVLVVSHHEHYELRQEINNKRSILSIPNLLSSLIVILNRLIGDESRITCLQSVLNFFTLIVCSPYNETTPPAAFISAIKLLVDQVGKALFWLLNSTCVDIQWNAGRIIKSICEEGNEDQFLLMQSWSISEGGFLREFYIAAFSKNREQRDLARSLISYWAYNNSKVQDILRHMVPVSLLFVLQSKEALNEEKVLEVRRSFEESTDEYREKRKSWIDKAFGHSLRGEEGPPSPVLLRSRNIRVHSSLNWPLFFADLGKDYRCPHLIWNHMTRMELRQGIENELQLLRKNNDRQGHPQAVAWNYMEFEIAYASLQSEVKIGDHYPRLLFEREEPEISRPKDFFNDLYHRFLLSNGGEEKIFCLQGMTILLKYYAEAIGVFHDVPYFVEMLKTTLNPVLRDSLIDFFFYLINSRLNAKVFIDSEGPSVLAELIPLAHLHVDRPKTYTVTNAIQAPMEDGEGEEEGNTHCVSGNEKVWLYSIGEGQRGPFSYFGIKKLFGEGKIDPTTKMWAQGLSSWKSLQEIPQLRWGLLTAKLPSIFSLSDLSCRILDIYLKLSFMYPSTDESGSVMSPLPKIRRFLSDPLVLPHIIQLLLTFDSGICGRVHRLLCNLVENNPISSRIYCTGVFFFALMYNGSDILSLLTFLRQTHRIQSYKYTETTNEVVQSSILAPILPPAMICTLSYKDAETCATIFLQDCENPEIIWSGEMRNVMISKIAAHVADFTPRLLNNIHSVYHYCPIERIVYAVLKDEIFCHEYYLRHLCDETRFSQWEIRSPARFLSELLQRWKVERTDNPDGITFEECCETLEIEKSACQGGENGVLSLSRTAIRQAYLKLLPRYHPDKNPDGRERFEKIQKVYEYLLSESGSGVEKKEKKRGRIYWILTAQVITLRRCRDEVSAFKYPGFRSLVQLLNDELENDPNLRDPTDLLLAATELCSVAITTTPLNADELREEGGIVLLCCLLEKCFDHFSANSKEDDAYVKVAINCLSTLSVAAQLEECRSAMKLKTHVLCKLLVDGIGKTTFPLLMKHCINSCMFMCMDPQIQEEFVSAGAQWQLLRLLFVYDATTDHKDVQWDEMSHKAFLLTNMACGALHALYSLAGYVPDVTIYTNVKPFPTLQTCLDVLLTSYITKKMQEEPNAEKDILKLLNSNTRHPYYVWNNAARSELFELLDSFMERSRLGETLICILETSLNGFTYASHRDLLKVGNVFLPLYMSQPNYPIDDPRQLFKDLCSFWNAKYLSSLNSSAEGDNYAARNDNTDLLMVTRCLKYLYSSYPVPVVGTACIMVHSVLNLLCEQNSSALEEVLELHEQLFSSPEYAAAVERTNILPSRLGSIAVRAECKNSVNALSVLQISLTYRGIVEQSLHQKLYILLLYLCLSECASLVQKEKAAQCLAVAFSDKLFGAQLYQACSEFLPRVFLESIKDNCRLTSHLLCTWQDNPELYWTKERKKQVEKALQKGKERVLEGWSRVSTEDGGFFKFEEHFELALQPLKEEHELADVSVGGVYLKSYLENPGWLVRNPKEFAMSLIDRFFVEAGNANITKDTNELILELMTKSIVQLFQRSPHLCDTITPLGYSKKLVQLLSSNNDALAFMALRVVLVLSQTNRSVEVLGSQFALRHLMDFGNRFPQHTLLWLQTIHSMVSHSNENCTTLQQALDFHLVEHLLDTLSDTTPSKVSQNADPAIVRALVIRILKQLLSMPEPLYIDPLQKMLENNSNWKKYRDYNHDLFLENLNFSSGEMLTDGSGIPTLFLMSPHNFTCDPPSLS